MIAELVQAALQGERRAMARLISLVEDEGNAACEAIAALYPHTGRAHVIGVTGAPGSGKSTLVSQLAQEYRRRDLTVGIVAVDPSSPFSGGAVLGDRIRMHRLAGDAGVFVRSMASRGRLGGLASGTANVVRVLDACGFQRILIETVGAGQTEVGIAHMAHTTVVIQVPDTGDDIQTLKAGILEIADVVVMNKTDLPGADRALAFLRAMLDLHRSPEGAADDTPVWSPPLLRTVATSGQGIGTVVDAIERHMAYLRQTDHLARRERERLAYELRTILREELLRRALARIGQAQYDELLARLVAREVDPYTATSELLRHWAVC